MQMIHEPHRSEVNDGDELASQFGDKLFRGYINLWPDRIHHVVSGGREGWASLPNNWEFVEVHSTCT